MKHLAPDGKARTNPMSKRDAQSPPRSAGESCSKGFPKKTRTESSKESGGEILASKVENESSSTGGISEADLKSILSGLTAIEPHSQTTFNLRLSENCKRKFASSLLQSFKISQLSSGESMFMTSGLLMGLEEATSQVTRPLLQALRPLQLLYAALGENQLLRRKGQAINKIGITTELKQWDQENSSSGIAVALRKRTAHHHEGKYATVR